MKKTRLTAIILTIAMLLGMGSVLYSGAFAAEPIKVVINGKNVIFPDIQPFTDENGRTLVPVRFVSESLGCNVMWDPDTRTVSISRGRIYAELTIGENVITVMKAKKEMDTAAREKDGRTLVPARFIAEAFGCDVAWDAANRTISITDPCRDVIKIGYFAIDFEEGDKMSPLSVGITSIIKKSGLQLTEGTAYGKPVLHIMSIVDLPVDLPKQHLEIEELLKQQFSAGVAEEVLAHVAGIKKMGDCVDVEEWNEGGHQILASGGNCVVSIFVYMDYEGIDYDYLFEEYYY